MVEVRPFCGWRYDPSRVRLSEVVAPPYDVINSSEQDALYAKSPYNIIRLILGKDEQGDTAENQNKYKRAASFLDSWANQGILVHDDEPAFYLYRQTFFHPDTKSEIRRIGIFAALKLEEYSARAVLPHERTHAAPKADRMNLIRSVKGNLSPVFGLYEDKEQALDSLFKSAMKKKPDVNFKDDKDMAHEIWILKDNDSISQISEFFKTQSVMIADGHHRYETALAYRDWLRENGANGSGAPASDYVLMALVNIYDEGLLVFPTHRLLKLSALPSFDKCVKYLKPYFSVFGFSVADSSDWETHLSHEPKDSVVIGLQWGGSKAVSLRLQDEKDYLWIKPDGLKTVMPQGKPDAWYKLDVNIVSHLIIQKILGIPPEKFEEIVSYTRYLDEAVKRVQSGEATIAIILRAPNVATVKQVCYSGEVMPQKSTYFYPKLPSGLLLHLHERR